VPVSRDSLFRNFVRFGIMAALLIALLFPAVLFYTIMIVLLVVLWHIAVSECKSLYLFVIRSVCRLE
jgi:hypothetical protein